MVFGRFAALVSRIAVGLGTHGGHEVDVQLDGTRGRGLAWSHEVEHIDEARRHFAEHAPRVLEPFLHYRHPHWTEHLGSCRENRISKNRFIKINLPAPIPQPGCRTHSVTNSGTGQTNSSCKHHFMKIIKPHAILPPKRNHNLTNSLNSGLFRCRTYRFNGFSNSLPIIWLSWKR